MKRPNPLLRHCLALLTFICVLWVVPSASAQSQSTGQQTGDSDITRRQLAAFDRFLDSHPQLSQQIRKDPSLINNEEFVENHADLQQFLQQHPEISQEFRQNPNAFMRQENRFDRREEFGELARMDQFFDAHPEVAEQLRKDPSLINNQQFLQNHPELQQFLQQHPEISQEFRQNPNAFMHQENRFDRREDRGGDSDITRRELVNMDQFLDQHPQIAQQLRKNPSLINNEEFVENNPDLQQFLQQHPGVREEVRENPNVFMRQEQRFDRQEDRNRDQRGDSDITRRELANMDQFLDQHPEIAEQLRKNPSLVNNQDFVKHHQALQDFLKTHPGAQEELRENPNAFMAQEQRFDQRENFRADRDVNRTELANLDRFLDSHPEIAEQLRKKPALVNDKSFVAHHPALQEFLAQHPGVREESRENPTAFMRQEQQFDRRQDSGSRRDRDVTRGELTSFNEFLEDHRQIAGELSKNPSLAKNEEYLENHPALQQYLKAHPQVHEELRENPQSFLQSAQQLTASSSATSHQEKSKALPNPK
jgi:phage-related protein